MRVLLVRHGNTFETGQTPFYVGARTDLPLTEAGRAQARALADALKDRGARPARVVCGPLKRTREHAEIVCAALGLPAPSSDARLTELDYGSWEGKTNAEVDAMHGGPSARESWDRHRVRPDGAGFSPDERKSREDVLGLLAELERSSGADDLVLLVSSNGLLGTFLQAVPGAYEKAVSTRALKTSPGHCGGLVLAGTLKEARFWNLKPGELPRDLLK
jgi:probable phosphoglycerate mutase